LWYFFLQVVKYHAASFQKTCTALAYRPALGARARFAFSNAHAAVLVFGGGSPAGLLSWRGAGSAADAWLAHARHGRGQDVGGVCIGVLRALFALPPVRHAVVFLSLTSCAGVAVRVVHSAGGTELTAGLVASW